MIERTKVLVCGATGFIGRNVVERLATRDNMEVVGTYYKTEPDNLLAKNSHISLVKVDLTRGSEVNELIRDKDVIIQTAAVTSGSRDIVEKPYIHVTDNAVMNSLIFRACFDNQVKHVVFFSCTTMYPPQEKPVREEDFNNQIIDKYFGVGWTKVYLEKMCEFYSRISPTRYTAIRHTNIYGPYDKFDLERSHVLGAMITKVMTNKDGRMVVWGDGSERRDLLYISDLVDFVEVVVDSQEDSYELINIGSGSAVSIKELVAKIIEISGRQIEVEYDLTKPTIKFDLTANIDKATNKYHWSPRISLEKGLGKTLAWYKDNILKEDLI